MSTILTLTPGALQRVQHLVQEVGEPETKLRVYITGGGCAGFQYGFTFTTETKPDDTLIQFPFEEGEVADIGVLVDPLSYPYLVGAIVDYKEGLYGAHFTVKNPNAKTTCGCGSSFSI